MMPTMSIEEIKELPLIPLEEIIRTSGMNETRLRLKSMADAAQSEIDSVPGIEDFPHYLAYLYHVEGMSAKGIVNLFKEKGVEFGLVYPEHYVLYLIRRFGIPPKEWAYKESKGQSLSSYPITPAEANILYFAALGYSPEETVRLLRISLQTIKNHRNSMFSSLGVFDITQAVILGYKLGWFDSDRFKDYIELCRHKLTAKDIGYQTNLHSALERLASESQINK